MEVLLTAFKLLLTIRWILILFVPFFYFVLQTRKDPVIFAKLAKFNGPISFPVVGSLHVIITLGGFRKLFYALNYKLIEDYGRIFRMWHLHLPQVFIASAKDAEKILRSAQHTNKSHNYALLRPFFGFGLITAHVKRWKVHRKLLNPAFNFNVLHKFLHIFNKNANTLVGKLAKITANGEPIDIHSPLSLCTLDIINETSMGTTINAQLSEDLPIMKSFETLKSFASERYFNLALRVPWLFNISNLKKKIEKEQKVWNEFTDEVVEKRKQYLLNLKNDEDDNSSTEADTEENRKNVSFIDIVLMAENGGQQLMSDSDIRDEVNTFISAGHDTITTTLSWSLFTMGNHPEIQQKVYEEIVQVFGDSDREPTMNDLADLKFMERCIKETMRLYPSIPIIERRLREDVLLDCGRVIPAGCTVTFLIFALHRDPEHYPDPEKFDPDRFLPENSRSRHPYAYLPFSAGPRNCIGQKYAMLELKLLFSSILRRFRVEATQKPEELIFEIQIVLQPTEKLKLRLFERNSP